MKSMKVEAYVVLSWIVSLVVTYGLGWWSGVKRASGFASSVGSFLFPVVMIAILLASVIAGFVAFRAGGYFSHRSSSDDRSMRSI